MRISNRSFPEAPHTDAVVRFAAGPSFPRKDGHRSTVIPAPPSACLSRHLAHALPFPLWVAFLILASGICARAQSNQVWPEVSTFVKINDKMRFYFLATTVKESRESTEGEYGPNFDFYLKPLRKRTPLSWLPQDESKNRLLLVRLGYRLIHPYTGDDPNEQRGVIEVTPRYPLVHHLLVSDRSRLDLRSKGGEFSWRYRNRLTVETEFSLGRVKINPYARGEIYYDSKYDKVSRNALIFGSAFPITRHIEFESYLEHQNDSGGNSNRTVNGFGVVWNLYF